MEGFYKRQARQNTKNRNLRPSQKLTALILKEVINFDVAKKVLNKHATELMEREPMNWFQRLHEMVTKNRREKKFDVLFDKYSLRMVQHENWYKK